MYPFLLVINRFERVLGRGVMAGKTYYLRTDFFLRRQNNGKYETKMAILRLFLAEKLPGFESGSEERL